MLSQKFTSVDRLVCKYTELYTMDDLVNCMSTKFKLRLPVNSTNGVEHQELKAIADQYDTIMMVRGDTRRAERI